MGTTKRQPLRHSVRFWNKPSRSWVMVARFSWQKDADQFLENISRSEAERETRFAQFFGNRLVSYCTGGLLTWPTPAGPTRDSLTWRDPCRPRAGHGARVWG